MFGCVHSVSCCLLLSGFFLFFIVCFFFNGYANLNTLPRQDPLSLPVASPVSLRQPVAALQALAGSRPDPADLRPPRRAARRVGTGPRGVSRA
jgi:hypothetical protein